MDEIYKLNESSVEKKFINNEQENMQEIGNNKIKNFDLNEQFLNFILEAPIGAAAQRYAAPKLNYMVNKTPKMLKPASKYLSKDINRSLLRSSHIDNTPTAALRIGSHGVSQAALFAAPGTSPHLNVPTFKVLDKTINAGQYLTASKEIKKRINAFNQTLRSVDLKNKIKAMNQKKPGSGTEYLKKLKQRKDNEESKLKQLLDKIRRKK